eukprot:TRINITY_DN32601_c0_g1_i1.p1 TRINITY_DN32601_c0_g1~~TRINITY_DN32601_c0_g1_i1.p1  ORF type:complete len:357 (+),score=68.24 TRINITY_DN32601_c0_g1_i1:80-1072(+)
MAAAPEVPGKGLGTKEGLEWLGYGRDGTPRFSAASVRELQKRAAALGLYSEGSWLVRARQRYSQLPLSLRLARHCIICVTGSCSMLVFRVLARGSADGLGWSGLQHLVEQARREGRGVITVSNHAATCDDPFLFGGLPWLWPNWNPDNLRWTWASEEICFARWAHALAFGLGQNIPILRGAGLEQPGVLEMQDKLDAGLWCHVFSEAMCSQEGQLRPFRWGVGRLIVEAQGPKAPLVVPMVHRGMEDLMPDPHHPSRKSSWTRFLPRPCSVRVRFGDPVDVSEFWEQRRGEGRVEDPRALYAAATEAVESRVRLLHQEMYPERYGGAASA